MKPSPKWIARVQQFMRGRYGQNDTLNRVLNNTALLLIIISLFGRWPWLVLIAFLLLIVSYWRLFSKKIYQQVAINRRFQRLWQPIIRPFTWIKHQLTQHWRFRFFHCAQCQQRIRIPRHHGRVRITCPKCGHQFEART
ncbi:Zn-Finger Containing protein [Lactiplantibacillus mudanjiangensis]|uniref:Zn-Finger Containing protein [Lactobacillus sp.] n=1 Tax=Lactiplantibacillus mudanjiangensis TaxID=1296538 RepID=A0A660DUB7_9LACO|nr:Zn-Finger Containing protein [Lactiplantibacillus mudanjiangensis]VDG21328.1 Zn-Finger Containing protein [Lactobacillus sp.] [Lactiplantibacillus mudanjiangensis]VDG23595.1 Zn-Finger Containing protein [Lactobacillus sp.] [Lactiplantibacillus mudanjiangensis]VDG27064.1 Zn-Finger Containing protein [Lactobacillus sp.] [Lactiplantibacillus mudanjiangensis]VDG32161.1 Zn-Finger Containing protein [Lactobacillus sp.] [Lactiplantibacillus mudanjiangensis]